MSQFDHGVSWRYLCQSGIRETSRALMMDLKRITLKGRDVAATLARAHTAHLTASNGTDLTFELARRSVHVDDGMIDKKDIENKSLGAQLPAGSVLTTIVETSGNGKVIFDRPLQSMGLNVLEIEWKFKEGKITSMKAKKNLEPSSKQFGEASGEKDRIGFIQIGLNPKARALRG